jgi:hypothetical protein
MWLLYLATLARCKEILEITSQKVAFFLVADLYNAGADCDRCVDLYGDDVGTLFKVCNSYVK